MHVAHTLSLAIEHLTHMSDVSALSVLIFFQGQYRGCHTYITLIPKKNISKVVYDYRPISRCNVLLYKIVAKVYANRLKVIYPQLISSAQSSYVPRRLISDNILIANKIMHHLSMKRQRKMGFMSFKL